MNADERRSRLARTAHGGATLRVLPHDAYARIERMLFDGAIEPIDGTLAPDLSTPGHGLTFKRSEAQRFANSS